MNVKHNHFLRGVNFKLSSPFKPAGDQPQSIKKLAVNLEAGAKHQVFLGVTGSGKSYVMAKVIENLQRPALIIEPNKVLAAQLYQEFKEFFPKSPVHYFVSYYDYYQPESYIPQTDTYIEKDASINEEIDRLRHQAVQDLLSFKEVIVVASVSCIYNLGSPATYSNIVLEIKPGQDISRKDFLKQLIFLQYQRNDIDLKPGAFRVRGDIVEIRLVTGRETLRAEFWRDEINSLYVSKDSLLSDYKPLSNSYLLYPAKFWVTPESKLKTAIENIKLELGERLKFLKKQKKLLEAERLDQRTNFDLQMMLETGYCHGIENYSRHLEFRKPGQAPFSLLDYFQLANPNFLVFIDESHLTCSQIKAMSVQDRARKKILIEYGFRLPSAVDNRPLTYQEFENKATQITYVSATPGDLEIAKSGRKYYVEQLIRPTGLLEPEIEIRPTKNQIKDLIEEIRRRVDHKQRALVITLTKRLAEDLNDFFRDQGIRSHWLHSETKTLERPKILKNLRLGEIDVLVGINLLREGLDLPEVSLVAILDADKEGFLRSQNTLIQTMGRASRNLQGKVILYADKTTKSMGLAIKEIKRRRKIQAKYNLEHKLSPRAISKAVRDWPFAIIEEKQVEAEFWGIYDRQLLEKEMKEAANNLDFERAAKIRDIIKKLQKPLSKTAK
ncbi:MAG: excinuclease ABC subunit UvrB [bacterium]|nr:excinuclease ABC subunit UvrB [bacterium]